MAIIGYIRVSSNKQTLEHQRFEIENFAKREGIKIDEWIEEKISSGLMKTTAKIASTKAAKSAGKVATKVGAKAVGKSVLKKIPLISLGAGAYFAYDRIKHGEYKAAFCEMASGVAGCFPGLGTGISVAIDAGLAGNDIYSAVSAEKDVQVSSANDNKASKLAAKKVWIKSGRLQEQENKRPVQQTTVNVKDFIQDKIRA